MTDALLPATVTTLLADPANQAIVVEALTLLDVTYERTPEADPSLVALYPLIDLAETPTLWGEVIESLSVDSLALLVRLTEIGEEDENGLDPRRTVDVSAIGYLAGLVNGTDFLLAAHVVPEPETLPGLRAITRDVSLTQRERSAAIFDLHPRAADLCSFHYAGGADPDEAGRYAVTLRAPGDTLFCILDRETGTVLMDHAASETCTAYARFLNSGITAQAA